MSNSIPIKLLKRVTDECRYCGGTMFPSFDSNTSEFYFRCPRCKSQSASCHFSSLFVDQKYLKECIDDALLGLDLSFEFEEEEEEEKEGIQDDKRKQIDAIKAMHSAILNSYNVFKQKVVSEFDNEDNQDQ